MADNRTYLFLAQAAGVSAARDFVQSLAAAGTAAGRVVTHFDEGAQPGVDWWPTLEKPSAAQVHVFGGAQFWSEMQDMTGHWPSAQIHWHAVEDRVEAATGAAKGAPGSDAGALAACSRDGANKDQAFTVQLRSSGQLIPVAAHQSILQALRLCGHDMPSSCESGSCGTCRTGLVAGQAEHRDFVLFSDEQADNIMLCVSRAVSPVLVLDL